MLPRFSLKWLLAATVYVALAAAAFTQSHWAWTDALWLASFLAVCYAAALAIFARGDRRARAIGFLIGSLALLIALQTSPDSVPTARIVEALSEQPNLQIPAIQGGWAPSPLTATGTYSGGTLTISSSSSSPQSVVRYGSISPYAPQLLPVSAKIATHTRAANALATILAGLAATLLATAAYRTTRCPELANPTP